uniref:Uncharacterized protein n=1 Tax=Coccidioides posadasii RMSCC 3488 TaxID=454284 RepID=A0A0J6FCB0_COCPO|nr:hypothetical protein CPAG_06947 [Coccidioides posadasii RMSCC 3488]
MSIVTSFIICQKQRSSLETSVLRGVNIDMYVVVPMILRFQLNEEGNGQSHEVLRHYFRRARGRTLPYLAALARSEEAQKSVVASENRYFLFVTPDFEDRGPIGSKLVK